MATHIISSRSDSDPRSGFLVTLYVLMGATFGLGLAAVIAAFILN